jgi:hypothetical protein
MTQVGLVDNAEFFNVNDEGEDEDEDEDEDDEGENGDDEYDNSIHGYDLEAYFLPAWDLLRIRMLGGGPYLCETAYNPFTLIRLGNIIQKQEWIVNLTPELYPLFK